MFLSITHIFSFVYAHDDSLQVFKSELLCKSQANKHLTVRDIESANRKVKVEISKTEIPPEKKHKLYVTYTAKKRASVRRMVFLST